MAEAGLEALLLTTDPEIRYFSGFMTPFWYSPTRPWFLIVPRRGKPVAVIPEIGRIRMAETWIDDIHAWPAPRPADDGVSLLGDRLHALCPTGGAIGLPMGPESHLRMPLNDFAALSRRLSASWFQDASPLLKAVRMVKSEAEITKIRHACEIVSDGFAGLGRLAAVGDTERMIFRRFRISLLALGADDVPYLVGGAGPQGPADIIGPPSDRQIRAGDLLMLDTGVNFDGYHADFDRNFSFGTATDMLRQAYDTAYRATEAGLQAARPGVTAGDLWRAMAAVLDDGGNSSGCGRLGHGLGMQLTEPPSLLPDDETVLRPGMVMTLEPSLRIGKNGVMVHEENLVIRDGPPQLLSRRAPPELPLL